jgi:hypothetical protein
MPNSSAPLHIYRFASMQIARCLRHLASLFPTIPSNEPNEPNSSIDDINIALHLMKIYLTMPMRILSMYVDQSDIYGYTTSAAGGITTTTTTKQQQ